MRGKRIESNRRINAHKKQRCALYQCQSQSQSYHHPSNLTSQMVAWCWYVGKG